MIIAFDKEYLRDLYETGKTTDKKYRFQPEVIKKYRLCVKTLQNAEKIEDLFVINSLNYQILKGNKQAVSSIRVNKQYRIEFVVTENEVEPILYVCSIIELSNHYK